VRDDRMNVTEERRVHVEMEAELVDKGTKQAAFERFLRFRGNLIALGKSGEYKDRVHEAQAFIDDANEEQTDIRVVLHLIGKSWVEVSKLGDELINKAAAQEGIVVRTDDDQIVSNPSEIYDEMSRQLANA